MSEIEDIANMKFDEQHVDLGKLGKLDVVKSLTVKQDLLEGLLGVVLAPADDTPSTPGWHTCDGKCKELLSGMDLCPGGLSFSFY